MYDILRTLRRGARHMNVALVILAAFVAVAVTCRLLDIGSGWLAL